MPQVFELNQPVGQRVPTTVLVGTLARLVRAISAAGFKLNQPVSQPTRPAPPVFAQWGAQSLEISGNH